MKIRAPLFTAILVISPLAGAVAQQTTGPNLKADSTKEANDVKNGSATNPRQPGATGSTIVPGSRSTTAGDQQGTNTAKSGGGGSGK